MNEHELPRRIQQHEAEEKLGFEAGVKFMALQAKIRMNFLASEYVSEQDSRRFWEQHDFISSS
jgi:hypothetical protein